MHFSMRIHSTGKRSLRPCAFVVSLLPHIRKPAVSSIYHNTELILFSKKETRTRYEKHRIKGADYYLKSTTRIWRWYRFSFSCIIVDDKLLPIGSRYATYESFLFSCCPNKLHNFNSGNFKRDNGSTEIFDVDHTPFLCFICFRSNCRGYAEQNNTMGRTDSDGIHWSAYPVRKCITWLSLLGYRSCIYITRYVSPGIVVQVSYFCI